jgi:hypothetical protein
MLHLVVDRPIFARAARDNIGSIRVLQKCDFKIIGKNKDFANGRGDTRFARSLTQEAAVHSLMASPSMWPPMGKILRQFLFHSEFTPI